jgi:Adenosyl cobinamide kinase/adenosyl cobinamide phosphate guanylyltransferase
MKTLFTGGVKSGKSRLAEAYLLEQADGSKPYYLATTEFVDGEMEERIRIHRQRRQDAFITIEEPVKLLSVLQQCPGPVLVECISMWLNNQLFHGVTEAAILAELEAVMQLPCAMVLVLNEVGLGIIPDNALARQYVDLSGRTAQLIAAHCERVYFCSAGLKLQMK